ncbi:hypothetical protein ACFSFY_09300 [Sporosarcina siberiensis]|uniref:Lipoprotein n=1 Tax=Sporosarcina siberiensis TaxID=1365606 RepID=A0ABW4SGI8_9BACL
MKMKLFQGLSIIALIVLLSGCSGTEGLIESAENLINSVDKLVQDETAKNKDIDNEESEKSPSEEKVVTSKEVKVDAVEDEQEGEDPETMFGEDEDDGSVSPDYFPEVSPYYDLYDGEIDPPNGYFLPMYDDWQLVSVIKDGSGEGWQGKFCYDSDPYYVASQYFADIEDLGLRIQESWYEDDGQETAEGFDHKRFAYYYGADYDGTIEGLDLEVSGKIEFFTDSRGEYCAVSTFYLP